MGSIWGVVFFVLLITLLALNIYASYVVLNTYFEVKERRWYQILFVWLIPFIGGSLVIYINREDLRYEKQGRQVGNSTSFGALDEIEQSRGAEHRGGR